MTDTIVIPYWKSCPPAHLRILGVEFKDRVLLQSRKAGFKKFLLFPDKEKIQRLPERFLLFFPNIFLLDSGWKELSRLELAPNTMTLLKESDSIALICTKDSALVAKAFEEANSYQEILANLNAKLKCKFITLERREWLSFKYELDRKKLDRWLLRGLIKDNEGFMSRHLERKISLAVTRRLVDTRMTPNQMTFVSLAIGLAGALCFAFPQRWYPVVGAFLFWLHSVLDGCDGEMARLKFSESRWGGLLDFWGDNVVHSAVFSCIALRIYLRQPSPTPWILAALAVAGTLLSAGWVYWTTMRAKKQGPLFTSVLAPSGQKSAGAVQKVADFLARRDFIYLVFVLALIGKIEWFLWMGAIGSPIYFLTLLVASLKRPRDREAAPISQEILK